jgi:hypothetical protein
MLSGTLGEEHFEPLANVTTRPRPRKPVWPDARLKAGVKLADIVEEDECSKPLDILLRKWAPGGLFQPAPEGGKPHKVDEACGNISAMVRQVMSGAGSDIEFAPGVRQRAGPASANRFCSVRMGENRHVAWEAILLLPSSRERRIARGPLE